MNKDKVYLKAHVIGHATDTLGYHGLMVQLENLDIVEIDKNLVHRDINEPKKPVVPQFVADWIEECKNDDFHLFGAMEGISSNQKNLITGLEKMTIWKSLPVHGWTDTRSIKRSGMK